MDDGEQFEILLGEQSKNIFGNKGEFGNFSREHGNTDPWGASELVRIISYIQKEHQRLEWRGRLL